jgi:hypothetical protein
MRTRYGELVFLHLVGSAGHIMHSSAFGTLNIDAIFFILGWDEYGFHKKSDGTCKDELVFLHLVGSARHVLHFSVSGAQNVDALFFCSRGTGTDPTKSASEHITPNLCFCIWYKFQKKCPSARYTKLMFLHPVGSTGHIVCCGVSGACVALFFLFGWDQ